MVRLKDKRRLLCERSNASHRQRSLQFPQVGAARRRVLPRPRRGAPPRVAIRRRVVIRRRAARGAPGEVERESARRRTCYFFRARWLLRLRCGHASGSAAAEPAGCAGARLIFGSLAKSRQKCIKSRHLDPSGCHRRRTNQLQRDHNSRLLPQARYRPATASCHRRRTIEFHREHCLLPHARNIAARSGCHRRCHSTHTLKCQ